MGKNELQKRLLDLQFKGKTMKRDLLIYVFEIVGNPVCVASSDGKKIFDRLVISFKKKRSVMLSFKDITMLTPAFLNSAIGNLYDSFSDEEIHSLLDIQDMQPDDIILLKRVVDTAKQYFKDPKIFKQIARDNLENNNNIDNFLEGYELGIKVGYIEAMHDVEIILRSLDSIEKRFDPYIPYSRKKIIMETVYNILFKIKKITIKKTNYCKLK